MKPHLLRVDAAPERFAALFAAAREAGLRVGWLELGAVFTPPPSLAAAAGQGALRAVALGDDVSLSVKPRRGGAVLADLLREHFMGCALVLVEGRGWFAGLPEPPLLRPPAASESEWSVEMGGDSRRRYTAADLIGRLRRPRPWDES